jgi:hypothetical protein
LPFLELYRKVGERSVFRGNSAFDLADGFRAFLRVFLVAKSVNFVATVIGHHMLKAEMRQPAELQ